MGSTLGRFGQALVTQSMALCLAGVVFCQSNAARDDKCEVVQAEIARGMAAQVDEISSIDNPAGPEKNPETNFALNSAAKWTPVRGLGLDVNGSENPGTPKFNGIDLPKVRQATSADSGWQFGVAPYLFAAGISGTVGARGRQLEVDANFGNVWENLDIGFMGAFEARKGRFVSFNDMVWVKLSAEKDTPGRFYSTAKLGINLFILDPEAGYRLIDSQKGSLDVLGGVRIWSVETNLNVTTGVLPGFDVSQRKTWGAPVVGVHGTVNVTRKFFLAGKFDIGGAGIGADLTTQLYGAAGYKITKRIALIGGYRWLQVDYDDDEGFLFDTQMSGLLFGAKFTF